jgi:hypothetical protein
MSGMDAAIAIATTVPRMTVKDMVDETRIPRNGMKSPSTRRVPVMAMLRLPIPDRDIWSCRVTAKCAPDAIRTHDTFFRREVLYPLSYRGNDVLSYTHSEKMPAGCGAHH